MSFMHPYKDLNPQLNRLADSYIGIVEDNNDPKKLQRIKVRVPSLFKDIPTTMLPWATRSTDTARNSNQNGEFIIPSVGQKVIVTFDNHDIYSPVYSLGMITSQLSEFSETYTTSHGFQDEYGNVVIFSDKGITIKDNFTNIITIDENGITIKGTKKATIDYPTTEITGDVTIDKTLTVKDTSTLTGNVTASANVTIAGNAAITGTMHSSNYDAHTHTCAAPGSPSGTPSQ